MEPRQAFSWIDICRWVGERLALNGDPEFASSAGSVYVVTPAFVWAGLVEGLTRDASLGSIAAKSREVAYATAPRKSTYLTLGDAGGSRFLA